MRFASVSTNFRAPLSVRSNNGNGGPGSEYSLPPSYRARNNLLRIPAIIGGNGGNNVGQRIAEDTTRNIANVPGIPATINDSTSTDAITETRAIITTANQRHQKMQQQQQAQHQQQRNSIITDTITSSNDVNSTHNTLLAVDDSNANNMKISQICNVESRTGVLAGVLPILAKTHSQTLNAPATITTTMAKTTITTNSTSSSALTMAQSKLSKSATDIHDIDRLFLNSSNALSDTGVIMNNDYADDGGNDRNRKDLVTIVTISGCTNTESSTGEMDILAHL